MTSATAPGPGEHDGGHDWPLNANREGPIWSWFEVERYARHDALAFVAARSGDAAAVDDYLTRGDALGFTPNAFFDPAFYRVANPGVATRLATGDYRTAFDHYRDGGWRDRQPHWLFSTALYCILYPDLTPDAVDSLGGLYGHYLNSGAEEGRIAHRLFDPAWYVAQQTGDEAARAASAPFRHLLARLDASSRAGTTEPLASLFFDPVWYRATYPDAARAITAGQYLGALHHYVTVGMAAGLDPLCDFSEADYRAAYPDVAEAIGRAEYVNGYEHFLVHGAPSLRSPCRHVNLAWYATQPSVMRDLASGRYAHAFAHLLAVGVPGGLALAPPAPLAFAPDEAQARLAFLAQARRALPGYGRNKLDFLVRGEPALSVIVILHNQFALTMQALASLRATFDGAVQLIVVDNASHDATRGIAELVLGAEIIRLEENIGFLRACNLALGSATAPTILYMNNDVILHANAVRLARDRLLADPSVGAVGGKIIRTHGLLQEAGCLVWRDGSADGWMRDGPPDVPEANYVRDVDYCSGAFLMVRGELLHALGGFAEEYAPAYYEETDLCLRIQARGYRVVYDPAVVLTHFEYASSRSLRAATSLMLTNRLTFRTRHPTALRSRVSSRDRMAEAAAFATRGRRVLFIEDTVPLHRLGSGYGRAADVVGAMARAGWQVSVFPMHGVRTEIHQITAGLPETVEILWDRDHRSLASFLAGRSGYYDAVWISRAHNLRQFNEAVGTAATNLETARLVLDTEAVFSLRDAARAELDGLPFDLNRSLAREFEDGWLCDHVIAVNHAEARVLRTMKLPSVGVVGFCQTPRPTARPWQDRVGLLHVGALTVDSSPNLDGLRWFLDTIHPLVETAVGSDAARVRVAGWVLEGLDVSWLRNHPGVVFYGEVANLEPLYDSCRVFIAPTRFAAGVPTKVLDAASHGLPVVATTLLAGQLGWSDGREFLASPVTDAAGFAARVTQLLTDPKSWTSIRQTALAAIESQFGAAAFSDQVAAAMTLARDRHAASGSARTV